MSEDQTQLREKIIRAARKPFGITTIRAGKELFDVKQAVLSDFGYATLTAFTRDGPETGRKFLVVPPLAGAFPVLLRDLTIGLLREADSVAVADWLDPRFVPPSAGRFGFRENVRNLVDMIRSYGPDVHVVAVCQAVSPALAATALLAANERQSAPKSLTLIGGPIDPAANPTSVAQALASRPLDWIRDNLIEPAPPGFPGSARRVYAKERQFGSFLSYLKRHLTGQRELFWKLLFDDGEDPLCFPFWALISSLMDLTEEFVLEDIRTVFHERALVRGALHVDGCLADPRAVTKTALMTIEASADDLAGRGQTRAALDLVGRADAECRRHLLIEECGHFALFHGAKCRRQVVPEIVRFVDRATSRHRRRVVH